MRRTCSTWARNTRICSRGRRSRRLRGDKSAAVFLGILPKGFPTEIAQVAQRKLRILNAATGLDDLKLPPNIRLEALRRGRVGQHSTRINQQWCLCFVWRDGDAYDVEIVDCY
ncbi:MULTISPECIES: type II toxin-antitoxin system RelE/ParE family toxin [Roseomonadaceae]|uniref:Type II toxin-antitoxin system RelE/ParE family toxin n=1 Tax=Falsiroseomonas oleicola TaxID=2801474 RepID=A0ABS6H2X2_9PROT|nr:type II toxin-antitoxin system RelE/ParE family toxin [Roseomonas oleicola]MBU8543015.1 type II toxin-antitoxin system RelE/ParE family toxin [Roseomonas oleicola]